ncbi:MAG TPA: hypothetical protein VIG50_05020 [Vicinamibacteria bacterium]
MPVVRRIIELAFGQPFERASRHGLTSQWEGVSDAAFMALVLDATAMAGAAGVARYRDEFDEV